MSDLELVSASVKTALVLSGEISGFIARAKARRLVNAYEIKMLEDQTQKALASARLHNIGDLIEANLEEIAKTESRIKYYKQQGSLEGKSLDYAFQQLDELNKLLVENLRNYQNRW